jgi:hypothetical protein
MCGEGIRDHLCYDDRVDVVVEMGSGSRNNHPASFN